ncbi:DUF4870 domain-containing protein [Myroides guanonis]|uniref:Chloroplast import component protein (Tic20) n=1 Tax=Myroides guanonis TaxID=1150112 RepID=A0A1I3ULY1_9FLAO|nr:hypothetical protein [Myroides guanonis]SFJ83683.1 hypothetical protein SAMN04487893_11845 [Myroides guanonis]
METNNRNSINTSQGKTIAIVSYLTIIGTVIAFIMNKNNPTSLGRFHIRQSIGITVISIGLSVLNFVPVVGGIIAQIASILILVALILGIIAAVKEEEKPTPFIGGLFQKWFSSI